MTACEHGVPAEKFCRACDEIDEQAGMPAGAFHAERPDWLDNERWEVRRDEA